MITLGQLGLKIFSRVYNNKTGLNGFERSQLCTPMIKFGQMVLKGVNSVHNDQTGSNDLERSQLGTQ